MATRYWVGGSGNWDATSTTNWSATSGGASGASAPTSVDDVIFDANSNTGTTAFAVTVTGTSVSPALCRDFSTGGAGGALDAVMTFTMGATAYLSCFGSMTLPASNFTCSATAGSLLFLSATTTGKTFTTNGVSLSNISVYFSGIGGEWTLGSAISTLGNISSSGGTFITNNYNVTCATLLMNPNANTKVVTLGSSTVTLSTTFTNSSTGGLTFNAGTSQITCSATATTFAGGGLTFYNVSFTSASQGFTYTISGNNTFNNLTFTSPSTTGVRFIALPASTTVNGTLTLGTANTAIRRIIVVGNVGIGTQVTLTVATIATLNDVDFRDIAAAGASGTWSGTRLGNAGNNSNITFAAGVTKYWNLVAGGNWSATAWALTSGGAVDVNNFPLPQDTVIIENTGLNTSATITIDNIWQIGTINASTRSNAMTFATGAFSPSIYGNLTFSSSVTTTGSGTLAFVGYNKTQTITSAGVSFTQSILINSPTDTITLADNLTSAGAATLTSGTLNLNDKTLTCTVLSSSNSNTRAIAFGTTGVINLTGNSGTIWSMGTATGFTYTGTSTVNCTYSGSTAGRNVYLGTTAGLSEANAINVNFTAGTDIASFSGVKNINLTGFSGTITNASSAIYGNLTIPSGLTYTATATSMSFLATSGTQQITTNGVTIDCPIIQNGVGGTVQLQDNLTSGSTRTYTLTNGTLNVNGKTLTSGAFSSSNSNARTLNLGTNGKITLNGGGWTATTSTNLSLTGTGTIDMTYGTAKTFAGGSKTYPYTLNQGGAGALTITGSNQFANISNTVQPATITFTAGTTTSVQNFTVSGTSGNLITLNSTTPGVQWTLAKV
jgi:hypothetical protein